LVCVAADPSFSMEERWWDQTVHYPPPPPSLPPLPPPPTHLAVEESCSVQDISELAGMHADECSTLHEALQRTDTGEHITLEQLGLRDLQVVGLASRALRESMRLLTSSATGLRALSPRDATFATAAFVARQPTLRWLAVMGAPAVDLASFRALAAEGRPVSVGHLDKESALFVGAVLASSDCTLVTTDGRHVSLRALRESVCVRLRGERGETGLCDPDLAALLGAISRNARLEELDLCENPAPTCAWTTRALADATRRARTRIRHHRQLELPGVVRLAPNLPPALPRPSWLAPYASAEPQQLEEAGEYCVGPAARPEAGAVATARGFG